MKWMNDLVKNIKTNSKLDDVDDPVGFGYCYLKK